MIVRLHQIDPADAEALSFWDTATSRGPIRFDWPRDWYAYQITALDRDEQQQPVPDPVRRRRLRQLLPTIITGLSAPVCRTALRLDGPLLDGELLAIYRHLADGSAVERYCTSAVQHLDSNPPVASVRLLPSNRSMSSICNDAMLGLEKSVRLRAFCVPEAMVDPLLDSGDLDDERWREILPGARYVLSTTRGLLSLVVWTPIYAPEQMKRHALGAVG